MDCTPQRPRRSAEKHDIAWSVEKRHPRAGRRGKDCQKAEDLYDACNEKQEADVPFLEVDLPDMKEETELEASETARSSEQADLLITRVEDGVIEFEMDGKVYRMHDSADMQKLIAAAGPPHCQVQRAKPSSLLRAQKIDKMVRADAASSSSGTGSGGDGTGRSNITESKAGLEESSSRSSGQRSALERACEVAKEDEESSMLISTWEMLTADLPNSTRSLRDELLSEGAVLH